MAPSIPLIARAHRHATRVAFRTGESACTYQQLLDRSRAVAAALLGGGADLAESRVALLVAPGVDYVAAQWGTWLAGGIAVPLSLSAARPEWEYTLIDARVSVVVASAALAGDVAALCDAHGIRLIRLDAVAEAPTVALPTVDANRSAMILYTSGTTSKPKGVVSTHANITAQVETLVAAWAWRVDDSIPLFLPLHHIHGIVNVVGCALWSGAAIEPFEKFEVGALFERVRAGAYTLFMAVPTIYVKLIQALERAAPDDRAAVVAGFASMRLMVSGSAALPASIHEQWTALTGQSLLERYGMTEIGMALSNPLRGERRPGAVGVPLPGVEVRLKSDDGRIITGENEPGEIQVRGPGVFSRYWDRPEATMASFEDGWFRTGDMAVVERGYYRIMGRLSVDIIKSGGYKLSALEIEAVLLEHPAIRECAVLGLPDDTWGESVTAVVALRDGASLDLAALRAWCRDRMSPYKVPHGLRVVAELPRNAMGKVTKPAVRALFDG